MKIRSGFVSNSSSSSFIIAYKPDDEVCPTCGRRDFNFLDKLKAEENTQGWSETKVVIQDNALRIVEEYFDGYTYVDETDPQAMIEKKQQEHDLLVELARKNEEGWIIALISISHHSDLLNSEFESLKRRGKLVVIKDLN